MKVYFIYIIVLFLALIAEGSRASDLTTLKFSAAEITPPESASPEGSSSQEGSSEVAPNMAVPYGMMPGYTDDVAREIPSKPQEMILMEKPDFLNRPELHQIIFNNELTNEFLFRYQQTFGWTEQEENYFLVSRQGYYDSPTGLTATQQDAQRNQFAEYMVKRLVEFHTDNIMKNDPGFKKIYEIKQKVSNYKVDVGPNSKLDMTYSFVGNFANVTYTTPWGTSKATINMDPGSLVPGTPTEVLLLYTRPVTNTIRFETSYAAVDQAYRLMFEKRLTTAMSTNISETLHLNSNFIDVNREELTLLGFNWTF